MLPPDLSKYLLRLFGISPLNAVPFDGAAEWYIASSSEMLVAPLS